MNFFKRILTIVLILSVLGLHFPKIILAAQSRLFAKAVGITEHLPEILALPEEEIPVKEVKKGEKGKSRTWLWVLGGAVLVGIIAAVAGGGGGGGGSSGSGSGSGNDPVKPVDTGDITISW